MTSKMDEQARKVLGEKLKKAREEAKLTQAEIAKQADITTTYYAMAERGEVNPSFEILNKLIKILKVKASDIFPS